MDNPFIITGIVFAVALGMSVMIILVTEFENLKCWQKILALSLLGVLSAVFIILGIWLGE